MKYTVLLLDTTVFSVKQMKSLWLWVENKNTIYCIDVCSFPLNPDLVILCFLLLAHSVVDPPPWCHGNQTRETKLDDAQIIIERTRENEWLLLKTN